MLPAEKISQNYSACYELTARLLKADYQKRGYQADENNSEFIDLCQSVIGHPPVVLLLQQQDFSETNFSPVLTAAIDEVKRSFFPDVRKKRFIAIDAVEADLLYESPAVFETDGFAFPQNSGDLIAHLRSRFSSESLQYFEQRLLPRFPGWTDVLQNWLAGTAKPGASSTEQFSEIEEKLRLLCRFYPDGNVVFTEACDGLQNLNHSQIVHAFLNVYLGVERFFPANFLQRDGEKRAAIVVRFLIETILETNPGKILAEKDETFFIRHKLQNVYRFFNYSANRVLGNAFPELIQPWLHSRSAAQYWENTQHRVAAIRWLAECCLGLSPDEFYRRSLSKEDFARNGLSYMFNQYYNSVSKALAAAYPHLQPWEIGNVPFHYWNENTAATAIRWMIAKNGWRVDELPEKFRTKAFTRKTFSEFGLATLFEKKFSKNIYRAVSAAYPGRFQPWEFGKVSSEHWTKSSNVFDASRWIAAKEGLSENEVAPAIREQRFTFGHVMQYSIGAVLKKLSGGNLERIFAPIFWREHRTFLSEHKLLRKISALKNSERKDNLWQLLLYGVFYHEIQRAGSQNIKRYERIARRIRRRSILYAD